MKYRATTLLESGVKSTFFRSNETRMDGRAFGGQLKCSDKQTHTCEFVRYWIQKPNHII
jgi:hypothetical protein